MNPVTESLKWRVPKEDPLFFVSELDREVSSGDVHYEETSEYKTESSTSKKKDEVLYRHKRDYLFIIEGTLLETYFNHWIPLSEVRETDRHRRGTLKHLRFGPEHTHTSRFQKRYSHTKIPKHSGKMEEKV